MGFDKWLRVEVLGFSGRIWVFWRECMQEEVLKTHPQFVHMRIKYQGKPPKPQTIFVAGPYNQQHLDLNLPCVDNDGGL